MEQAGQPEAAVAIVHTRGPEESVLLIRRSEREDDSWSGHWSFPGGRHDEQDVDLLHTSLRELEEECAIRLQREQMETSLKYMVARRRTGPFVLVAPFVFAVKSKLPTVLDPAEAVEAAWVPRSLLRDPSRHLLRCVPGLAKEMLFPAIEMNSLPLWGFTYRLITHWLHLVPQDVRVEQAGFAFASSALDLVRTRGLKLKQTWHDRNHELSVTKQSTVKVATVEGVIPAEDILAHFSRLTGVVPQVNLVQVRPNYVRIIGLGFEEYLILAVDA